MILFLFKGVHLIEASVKGRIDRAHSGVCDNCTLNSRANNSLLTS
jgi:hypothetical protein